MVEGGDGVLERRRLGAVGYGRDLGLFAADALFNGRQEMLGPDAVEGGDVERRAVRLEEGIIRVLVRGLHAAGRRTLLGSAGRGGDDDTRQ